MATWRYEISLLLLKKYFTRSLLSLVKYFSTLEEKFGISARPCNILYISYGACEPHHPNRLYLSLGRYDFLLLGQLLLFF